MARESGAGDQGTIAIVLNYRTPEEAIAAVRSLQRSQVVPSTIVVVDNASNDGSVEQIRRDLTGIVLVETPSNGGFATGCNVGIREALRLGAQRVLLLNSDAVIAPDALGLMEECLDRQPSAGIVGPLLLTQTEPPVVESLGISYDRVSGRMRHPGFGVSADSVVAADERTVDAVSGSAMLVRREVFERVGYFFDDFFFGFEDLDLCLRARAAGLASVVQPAAVVRHAGAATIGRHSASRVYYATRNHLLLAKRCSPGTPAVGRWLRAGAILALNLAHVLSSSGVPRGAGVAAVIQGWRDHRAGRYGSGLE